MNDYSDVKEELISKILTLNENIWKLDLKRERIESWIEKLIVLLPENEREIGRFSLLHLLSQFLYFPIGEFRELLKSIFFENIEYPIIERLRNNSQNKNVDKLYQAYKLELKKIKFVAIGNPSESSSLLYYFLRQSVNLETESFITPWEIFQWKNSSPIDIMDVQISNYYFLDDLCGSGSQVIKETKKIVEMIKNFNHPINLNYLALFATQEGILNVKESKLFDSTISFYTLPDSYKVFSENSRYFSNSQTSELKESKKIFEEIGRKLFQKHPLGFKNTQLLLAFFYNTPNNTLPVFWKEQNKFFSDPIFKRYQKKYGEFSS